MAHNIFISLTERFFFCGIKTRIMQRANADFCVFNAYLL